jgi:ABC-2 type transport system ATP-binding protein
METRPEQAVQVHELEKRFGSFTAVNRISFSVKPGEIFGFLGPNGAGKSTTIRMLCGILAPTSGQGHVGGYDILREQIHIRQNIGYMSQKFSLYNDLTVEENIHFFAGLYSVSGSKLAQRKEWVMHTADLREQQKLLTGTLSSGWKQRLALGCALLHEPKIVFLDEPTSGVDPLSRQRFWDLIKTLAKSGVTVFVTTHYMDEAENCDRMALIYRGNIIAMGTPAQLKTDMMKETVLEVSVPEAQSLLENIKRLSAVKQAALFGTRLHIVTDNAAAAQSSLTLFLTEQHRANATVKVIPPSLEDVFVSLIENYDKVNPHEAKAS